MNHRHWIPRKNISGCSLGQQNIHRIQENIPAINADPECTICNKSQTLWIPRKNISGCSLGRQTIQENIPVINTDPGYTISENF